MYIKTRMASAIKLALIGGAATAALSMPVYAQEQTDSETETVERISVSGSRIQNVNVE